MRDFLERNNFRKAALFSACITLCCFPQISRYAELTPDPRATLVLMLCGCFLGMHIVCGMVLAWSRKDNMAGWLPEPKRLAGGCAVAVILAAVMVGFQLRWDPFMMDQVARGDFPETMSLLYPSSFADCLYLALWAATFEAMFFTAGAMSFFVRLSSRVWIGCGLCLILRYSVRLMKMAESLPPDMFILVFLAMAVVTLISCMLFARAGVFPVMLFHGLLAFRHLAVGSD